MISKTTISGVTLALCVAGASTTAQATTLHATNVDSYVQGANTMSGGAIAPVRLIEDHALGAEDGKFLSLGFGGEVVLSFGELFTGPMRAVEVTFGNRAGHLEYLAVYGGLNGVFSALLGTISNTTGTEMLNFSGIFDQLRLVDVSPVAADRDGFDIDAIAVSPLMLPLPAGGLLLLSALGAAAALRRRQKAA